MEGSKLSPAESRILRQIFTTIYISIQDTMPRNKKRSQRQPSPEPPRQEIKHDWKKDDEELELEQALFGRKQKKFKPDNNNDEESGMSEVEDNDVRSIPYFN